MILAAKYTLTLCVNGRVRNIEIDFTESGCDDVDWIQLLQSTVPWRASVNTIF
jgi:hypothetical protein